MTAHKRHNQSHQYSLSSSGTSLQSNWHLQNVFTVPLPEEAAVLFADKKMDEIFSLVRLFFNGI